MSSQYMLAVPNLPGTTRANDSWIYLQHAGFHKGTKTISRPQTAQPLKSSSSSLFQTAASLNQTQDPFPGNTTQTFTNRPGTAGASGRREPSPFLSQGRPMSASASTPNLQASSRPQTAGALGSAPLGAISRSNTFLPKFVETDKQVARFHAHFIQSRNWDEDSPIGNPTIESHFSRRLTILYYITDNTIELVEEKSQNTGFQGGNFFKRGPLVKKDGRPVTLRDLTPGNSLQCLGVEIFITDADLFTREYFRRELKVVIGPALPRPDLVRPELGAQYSTGLGVKAPLRVKGSFGVCSTDYRDRKAGLEKTNQYLKYEGKVLRFTCVEIPQVDPFGDAMPVDPETFQPTSTMRKYVLIFSLSDNKIEVRAMRGAGEEAKVLLKKNKLPLNWREVQEGANPRFFEPTDFHCGKPIDIYGRLFLLVNCDEFTRMMCEELGIEQYEVPVTQIVQKPFEHPIPRLGDGFLPIGRPEDTLATVYGMPKAIQSTKTVLKNQNRLLRARVLMLTNHPIDSTRSFQLSYYLEDNTVQVFEEVRRNSGIVGGNYLKRGRYMNGAPPEGGMPRYFKATDVFLGNIVSLNGQELQIVEMDNMSLLFCESFPKEFPLFDTFHIVHNLIQKAISLGINIRAEFSSLDINGSGWIDRENFVRTLDSLGLSQHLNDQQLLTLVRRFQEGDKYLYIEMADLFSHVHFLSLHRLQGVTVPEYVTDMASFLTIARFRSTQWRRVFRKDAQCWHGKVLLLHLLRAFKKHGLNIPHHMRTQFMQRYGISTELAPIAYTEIQKLLVAMDPNLGLKKIPTKRVDMRSRSRLQQGFTAAAVEDDDSVNETAAIRTAQQGHRRDSKTKVTSIMRSYNSLTETSAENHDENDETKWIVDYNKICDDIYICDWVK